jgi:hypothetical protein
LWHFEKEDAIVGFDVFTAVVLKNIIIWDMTPCSLLAACLLAGFPNLFLRP